MNDDPELERELAEHYRSMRADVSPALETVIAHRLDDAARPPQPRVWSAARIVAPLGIAAVFALVAAVVALPLLVGAPAPAPAASSHAAAATGPIAFCSDQDGRQAPTYQPVGTAEPGDVASGLRSDQHVVGASFEDTSLVLSDDGGRTWYRTVLGTAKSVVTATSAADLWAIQDMDTGSGDVVVWRCRDRAHWTSTSVQAGAQLAFVSLRAYDAMHAWIVSPGFDKTSGLQTTLKLLRTTDGGATWTVANMPSPMFSTVTPSDANTIWASADPSSVTATDQLLRVSRDGGSTWSFVTLPGLPSNDGIVAPMPDPSAGAGNAWIYTPPTFWSPSDGIVAVHVKTGGVTETRFFETADAGRTWAETSRVTAGVTPVFATPTVWFGLAPGSKTYQVTRDAGKSWQKVVPHGIPATTHFTYLGMYDATWGLAIVADDVGPGYYNGRVYATADGGMTWQPYNLR